MDAVHLVHKQWLFKCIKFPNFSNVYSFWLVIQEQREKNIIQIQ